MKNIKLDAICNGCGQKIKIKDVEKFTPWPDTDGGYMVHHKGSVCDPVSGRGFLHCMGA